MSESRQHGSEIKDKQSVHKEKQTKMCQFEWISEGIKMCILESSFQK